MTKTHVKKATARRATPVVFVADVHAAATFYRDALGFSVDFVHGEPPFYGSVTRDGACIHLKFVHEPVLRPGPEDRDGFISVYIDVDDVDALYAEYTAQHITMTQELRQEPWGTRDFVVRDPDGNGLCFSEKQGAQGAQDAQGARGA